MGNSASLVKKKYSNLLLDYFVDGQMIKDFDDLVSDPNGVRFFANFYKGGTWISALHNYRNDEDKVDQLIEEDKALEMSKPNCRRLFPEYLIPDKMVSKISSRKGIRKHISLRLSQSSNNAETDQVSDSSSEMESMYTAIDENCALDRTSTIQLLLLTIYPSFGKSSEYRSWISSKNSQVSNVFDFCLSGSLSPRLESRSYDCSCSGVSRVENLFLSAAALIEQDDLEMMISKRNWIDEFLVIIDNLHFAIAVSSTINDHPVLFTNKTFRSMTGYKEEKLVAGKDICSLLKGPDTETDQLDRWNEAVRKGSPLKIGITLYNSQRNPLEKLVAVQPVYDQQGMYMYDITVFVDPRDRAIPRYEPLIAVNDLLLLLPRLLIRPH